MSDLVTDAMLEAAAKADHATYDAEPDWDRIDERIREVWREGARAALEAVAPLIAAKALRDAADELRRLDDGRTGGYYAAGRDIIQRLTARAERIERGES